MADSSDPKIVDALNSLLMDIFMRPIRAERYLWDGDAEEVVERINLARELYELARKSLQPGYHAVGRSVLDIGLRLEPNWVIQCDVIGYFRDLVNNHSDCCDWKPWLEELIAEMRRVYEEWEKNQQSRNSGVARGDSSKRASDEATPAPLPTKADRRSSRRRRLKSTAATGDLPNVH